jgi:hypothetical protein
LTYESVLERFCPQRAESESEAGFPVEVTMDAKHGEQDLE